MKLLFIAPFHSQYDKRVAESLKLAAQSVDDIHILLDSNYSGNDKVDVLGSNYKAHYHPVQINRIGPLKYPDLKSWLNDIKKEVADADIIYIHESGIMGLWLCWYLKTFRNFIVFDYHDNLFFELYYQLKKVRLGFAYPFFNKLLLIIGRIYTTKIDFLVGINQIQINQFREKFKYKHGSTVVTNLRTDVFDLKIPVRSAMKGEAELIWIGNVMSGRDLELIVDLLCLRVNQSIRLNIFGNVLNPHLQETISSRLGERVVFHGRFNNDEDLAARIDFKPIGIYLGWEDPYSFLINEMSSPNKVFTFIKLNIPFIFNKKFSNEYSILKEGLGTALLVDPDKNLLGKSLHGLFHLINGNYLDYLAKLKEFREDVKKINCINEQYFDRIIEANKGQ